MSREYLFAPLFGKIKGNHEEPREVCRALMVLSIARVTKCQASFVRGLMDRVMPVNWKVKEMTNAATSSGDGEA